MSLCDAATLTIFFERLGDAVITDPAGNDLWDLRIRLMAESSVSN
jgi:hypothetical protein